MSFQSHFGQSQAQPQPLPATIITPIGPTGLSNEVITIGANGYFDNSYLLSDDDKKELAELDKKDPDIAFTPEQEMKLLIKMNEQQGMTIEQLNGVLADQKKRIEILEKELVEKPIPPICYVSCSHCYEEEKQSKK